MQEIDAASRTGVDDVRELIEAIRYAPSPGKHRIFVVDEVHMLSTAAFNALLKTLEEPPPRSLFVFATTNPEKIPFTVLSRCQRHDLRRIAAAEIVARLQLICRDEGDRGLGREPARDRARGATARMRDAQTLLDQIIAFGGTASTTSSRGQVLDLIDRRLLLAILAACVDGDARRALEACARAAEAGVDAKRLGENLLQLLRDLVVLRIAPQSAETSSRPADAELDELRELAERADEPARLRRMFRALVKEQEDLAWAPQPFAVLEMAVVRLATMPAGDDVAKLLARLDALERRLADGRRRRRRRPGGRRRAAGRLGGAAAGHPRLHAAAGGARGRGPRRRRLPPPQARRPAPWRPLGRPSRVVFDRLRGLRRGARTPASRRPSRAGGSSSAARTGCASPRRIASPPSGSATGATRWSSCARASSGVPSGSRSRRGRAAERGQRPRGGSRGPAAAAAEGAQPPRGGARARGARGRRSSRSNRCRRRSPAMTPPDLGELMEKAKQMQSRLAELQRELAAAPRRGRRRAAAW